MTVIVGDVAVGAARIHEQHGTRTQNGHALVSLKNSLNEEGGELRLKFT